MRGDGWETVTPLGFQARTSAWVSVRRSIEPEQSQGPLAKPDFARTGRDGHAFYWHRRIQGPPGRSCPANRRELLRRPHGRGSRRAHCQAKKFRGSCSDCGGSNGRLRAHCCGGGRETAVSPWYYLTVG